MDKRLFVGRIYLEVKYKHGVGRLIKALKLIEKDNIEDITKEDFISQGNCGVMTWILFSDLKRQFE